MRPGLIGIGAQKCASSFLHSVAGSHPEIGTSNTKEVDFFSYYFDRGYQWYEGHFDPGQGAKIYFESSPSYFHDPRAPGRAAAYQADLKVLALLRDPVKRAFSNHMHEIIKGHISLCPFEDGLANNPAYLEQGLYATHLSRWMDAFPRSQLRVLFAEDIAKDAGAVAREVFAFCGVDPHFDSPILRERRNESDKPRLPALRTGLRAVGDWMRRRGMESTLVRVKATGPAAALLRANKIDIRDQIPPMTPEMTARLYEYFAPEMARLRQILGREYLPWENLGQAVAQ